MGMTKADAITRENYADVLGENDDPAMLRLVQDLEWGYTSVTVPPALRSKPFRPAPGRLPELRRPGSSCTDMPRRWRLHTKLYAALAVVVTGAILLATGATMAGPTQASITNLGPSTNALSPATTFPLSGFHRIGKPLGSQSRPELLWIGTYLQIGNSLLDSKSAIERWPVIKALTQFGAFSRVGPAHVDCFTSAAAPHGICHLPSFDWAHARYRSSYLSFVHKDLVDAQDHPLQRLSAAELKVYNRYSRVREPSPNKSDPYDAFSTVFSAQDPLPLVLIGRYLQTSSQIMLTGDFESALPMSTPNSTLIYTGLPFDTVRAALVSGKDIGTFKLVQDVNAEANIITALICHADGSKPSKVCRRPVIKGILKSVR